MPIKGLSDNVQSSFPRLGKLRKGGEKVNGQYGPDLDHFRFTSETPEIVEAFHAAYGKEPSSVQVYIPYATPEEAFPTWAEVWGKTGLVHRCDGENMTIWQENGKYCRGSKPCMGGHEKGDYLNDAVGRLTVIIPELIEAGYVGYVTLETHAKNDILAILATLNAAYDSRKGNDLGLRGILFNLKRVQESISVPGFGNQAGKRSRVDKWLVKLEPAADWVRLQLEMAHSVQMNALPMADDLPALPSGEINADPETGEIIDGETKVIDHQPANGNGTKPATMSVADALKVKSPGGKEFSTLTVDQLKQVKASTDPKVTPEMKQAAETLLKDVDDWKTWEELCDRAMEAQIETISLGAGTKWIALFQEMVKLQKQLDDLAIPETFR
jgi:hypothetical protein